MEMLKKYLGKCERATMIWAVAFVVIASSSCRKTDPGSQAAVDQGDEQVAAANIAEAEPLYGQREELPKIRQAVALLRQARTADYGSYEAAWKLARADYYLGEHTTDDSERGDLFREGIDAGKVAIQLQPDKADGHFWLGANYGGSGAHSTLASLSTVEDIRKEMETVLKLDEGYKLGSAYLALGQLYLQAPRVLGGDNAKAISYLEKGLKFGDKNALLRLRLAQAYEATNRDGDARKQIAIILSMTPEPNYVPEHNEAVAKAKKLQEKLDSK
jgi:tetratricopeptide (TPR) repeat protein